MLHGLACRVMTQPSTAGGGGECSDAGDSTSAIISYPLPLRGGGSCGGAYQFNSFMECEPNE